THSPAALCKYRRNATLFLSKHCGAMYLVPRCSRVVLYDKFFSATVLACVLALFGQI
ncbi:hypothetical protein TorRG33x02_346560, partial [Trema orientale]